MEEIPSTAPGNHSPLLFLLLKLPPSWFQSPNFYGSVSKLFSIGYCSIPHITTILIQIKHCLHRACSGTLRSFVIQRHTMQPWDFSCCSTKPAKERNQHATQNKDKSISFHVGLSAFSHTEAFGEQVLSEWLLLVYKEIGRRGNYHRPLM